MLGYPLFLIYFSSIIIAIGFVLAVVPQLWWRTRNNAAGDGDDDGDDSGGDGELWEALRGRGHQITFFKIGVCYALNQTLGQFANAYVDGNQQTVLWQLNLPATALFARILTKTRLTSWNWIGSALVIGGSLLAALPPLLDPELDDGAFNATTDEDDDGNNTNTAKVVWVIVFTASCLPIALSAVLEEAMWERDEGVDAGVVMLWSGLYMAMCCPLVLLLGMLPHLGGFDSAGLMQNQRDAFSCFAGHDPLPPDCEEGAARTVLVFCIGYMAFAWLLTVLVQEAGSVFQALVDAAITPASAVTFSLTSVMGVDAEPLTSWVIAACFVVPLGVATYSYEEIAAHVRGEEPDDRDDANNRDGGSGGSESEVEGELGDENAAESGGVQARGGRKMQPTISESKFGDELYDGDGAGLMLNSYA